MIASQAKALEELRAESKELFEAAIQVDRRLLPFEREGPSNTPPKEKYMSPDGLYADSTRKWE